MRKQVQREQRRKQGYRDALGRIQAQSKLQAFTVAFVRWPNGDMSQPSTVTNITVMAHNEKDAKREAGHQLKIRREVV